MWPVGRALAVCFIAAIVGLAGLTWLALALLHPKLSSSPISFHDFVGVLQLVFASVAGAGALVALVMAYRRQRVAEAATAHDRVRVLNERFTTIAGQLGDDRPAVRLAGVHAMAGLADDWEENRQTCIDVLCAYLRMPYEPDPGDDAPAAEKLKYRANREVRHTAIRIIAAHLREDAAVSWQGMRLDFTGVVFDAGDFSHSVFSGGTVSFSGAQFSGGRVSFFGTQFSDGTVSFSGAQFSDGTVSFIGAQFSGGTVSFEGALFSHGWVSFNDASFSGGQVSFTDALFSGGWVSFDGTEFYGGVVLLDDALFSAGEVSFKYAQFSASEVSFDDAQFSQGQVGFHGAQFSGGKVGFARAKFSGGLVDLRHASDWSHPPRFDWEGTPPEGLKLPAEANIGPPVGTAIQEPRT